VSSCRCRTILVHRPKVDLRSGVSLVGGEMYNRADLVSSCRTPVPCIVVHAPEVALRLPWSAARQYNRNALV